jgi:hypothetical protein
MGWKQEGGVQVSLGWESLDQLTSSGCHQTHSS